MFRFYIYLNQLSPGLSMANWSHMFFYHCSRHSITMLSRNLRMTLRSIRRFVSRPVVQSLVTSFVLSRLDYGNATLAEIPQHLLRRFQSALNAAALLIYSSSRFDYITPLLRQLHWLKAKEWIDFKLAVRNVFKCLHGSALTYLTDELGPPVESNARCRLLSVSPSIPVVRRNRLTTVGDRILYYMLTLASRFHRPMSTFLRYHLVVFILIVIVFFPNIVYIDCEYNFQTMQKYNYVLWCSV